MDKAIVNGIPYEYDAIAFSFSDSEGVIKAGFHAGIEWTYDEWEALIAASLVHMTTAYIASNPAITDDVSALVADMWRGITEKVLHHFQTNANIAKA